MPVPVPVKRPVALRSFLYTWLPLIVGLLLLVLFISLGNWQWQRAGEKQAILEAFEQGTEAHHRPLDLSVRSWEDLRFQPVEFRGRYLPERQFLLDNQIRDGRVGYRVITPAVHDASGRLVLVERGWVPREAQPGQLPDVVSGLPAGRGVIRGQVYVPFGEGYRIGAMDDGRAGWPRVVQYMDFEAMGERLGGPVVPMTIRLDPDAPHGYHRDWRPVLPMGAERHMAYAVQWYAMALALVVIAAILVIRRRSKTDDK
jgi:surfeit locus 1 family protein